jgi:hypothetical protein
MMVGKLEWNKFTFWPNIQIPLDFELQISRNNFKFESHWNFKGVQTFWQNPRNLPKLSLGQTFNNINLYDTTCIWEFEVSLQVQFGKVRQNIKRFEFEIWTEVWVCTVAKL